MITVDDMIDRVDTFRKIFDEYQYKHVGAGKMPWSHRHEHSNGTAIEFRFSDWTFYDATGKETVGKNLQELKDLLKNEKY